MLSGLGLCLTTRGLFDINVCSGKTSCGTGFEGPIGMAGLRGWVSHAQGLGYGGAGRLGEHIHTSRNGSSPEKPTCTSLIAATQPNTTAPVDNKARKTSCRRAVWLGNAAIGRLYGRRGGW